MSSPLAMTDLTGDILNGAYISEADSDIVNVWASEEPSVTQVRVTKSMLAKKPKIYAMLKEVLKDAIDNLKELEREKVDENIARSEDDWLLLLLGCDPTITAMTHEWLYDLDDCREEEGEPAYRPGNCPEFDCYEDSLPHKYSKLSEATLDLLYRNPMVRTIVAKMREEHITEELVLKLLGSGGMEDEEESLIAAIKSADPINTSDEQVEEWFQVAKRLPPGPGTRAYAVFCHARDAASEVNATPLIKKADASE